ncbi:MBL fold metallo-hydrolase [Aquibacillus albus]|uniref:Glyoxylase-like metal-dependent hydrolase (Beta-lactamase superfamily II) n=1 Tax=Aquibacillus albus TaxID=1168171 RepID=A0ABS2N073_9BACI|nr:MBL fold metallo-hydrolase [Aquibacillus albus]MBM7571558.1 glyoxylase-like metal-dependent hydrolase (beta-lactamase superfamily II) [Aquibacillus albus]
MDFQTFNTTCYAFHGPVNIGYVQREDKGMLIDAGIDRGTMKKVMKQLSQKDLPITHLFITHAHTDHFGGAHYLQEQQEVHTMAPKFEEAIMRNPMLEPIYLFGGNDPLPELRNKFLEANPIRIDQVMEEGGYTVDVFEFDTFLLPGHSYYQLAVRIDGILYAGDAYFGTKQLHKHKIPYLSDAQQTLESLEKVKEIPCEGAIPGHGVFESTFQDTVEENIAYHWKLLNWLEAAIVEKTEAVSHENIVADMCQHFDVNAPQLSQWLLYRTAITGYLLALLKQEKITSAIQQGRWAFQKA